MKKLCYLILGIVLLAGCGRTKTDSKDFTEKVNGVEFDMVYVECGTFQMGATPEQGLEAGFDERPAHEVRLTKNYYIGKYEVTQELWKEVMGTTVAQQRDKHRYRSTSGVGPDYPMYYVSWKEAQEFCEKLSQLTGKRYALPTEAQWEYAARGGAKSKGYKYSGSNDVDKVAWHYSNSGLGEETHPVGKKRPNELGIYDMSGNVWEWCCDWYGKYSKEEQTDPTGPTPIRGDGRVLRGGSCKGGEEHCRVSNRSLGVPGEVRLNWGFRVVMIP